MESIQTRQPQQLPVTIQPTYYLVYTNFLINHQGDSSSSRSHQANILLSPRRLLLLQISLCFFISYKWRYWATLQLLISPQNSQTNIEIVSNHPSLEHPKVKAFTWNYTPMPTWKAKTHCQDRCDLPLNQWDPDCQTIHHHLSTQPAFLRCYSVKNYPISSSK